MQTIKTAAVVVLMMTVLYGIFIALNNNEPALPPGLADIALEDPNMEIELGDPVEGDSLIPSAPLIPSSPAPNSVLGSADTAIPKAASPAVLENLNVDKSTPAVDDAPALVDIPKSDRPLPSNFQADPKNLRSTDLPPEIALADNQRSPFSQTSTSLIPNRHQLDPSTSTANNTQTQGSQPPSAAASGNSSLLPSVPNSTPLTSLDGPGSGNIPSGIPTSTPNLDSRSSDNGEVVVAELSYAAAKEKALVKAQEGKLKEALIQMTTWFDRIELTRDEKADLLDLLNALAGEVIYSQRHFLEPSYKVGSKDTVDQVAKLHGITTELLASINQLQAPFVLLPNSDLKVLRGPFRAEINLTTQELTLFLDNMYAGQFPITVGSDHKGNEGTFTVLGKQVDRNYYASNGGTITYNDPRNPYGKHWIDLGQDLCIHGSPATENPQLSNAGCISLSPRDAEDVYNILTEGSKVTLKR